LFSIIFGMLQFSITILQLSITELYVVHVEYCWTANYPEINRNSVYSESPFPNAMEFIVSVNIRLLTIVSILIISDYMTFLRKTYWKRFVNDFAETERYDKYSLYANIHLVICSVMFAVYFLMPIVFAGILLSYLLYLPITVTCT
jgi:hypothetical protein